MGGVMRVTVDYELILDLLDFLAKFDNNDDESPTDMSNLGYSLKVKLKKELVGPKFKPLSEK